MRACWRRRLRHRVRRSAPAAARCSLGFDLFRKTVGDRSFLEQGFIFADKAAPGTQCVEAILVPVLVHYGGKGANLFEAFGQRHLDAEIGTQPAKIVKTILGGDAHVARDQLSQPSDELFAVKVRTVGMAERKVVGADRAIGVIGNADATNKAIAPRPAGTAIGKKPPVLGLGIERDDACATQVGQLGWWAPFARHR